MMKNSSSNQIESIYNQVTMAMKKRLFGIARKPELDFRESYLFRSEHVCGIKVTAGVFNAKWFEGDTEIQFFRDLTPIGTVAIDPQDRAQAG